MKRFCVAFAGVLALSLPLTAREKVIFDTDMGGDVDDALALAYLLSEPECDLLGVTVEAWGGSGPRQAEIVSALCRDQGRDVEIAIGPGAGNVLGRRAPKTPVKPPRYWPIVKGRDHREFTARNDAVDFLRRTVRANPGEVTILATGQFTNLSALFAVDPELPSLLKRLVIMGGNLAGTTEWNAGYDPVATAVVFANGNHARPPETLVIGAELTTPHHLPTAEARRFFAGIPRLELCAEAAEYWLKDFHALYFHDPIAAVAVFHPEIATWTNSTVAVDVLNGRTTLEAKPNPEHGPLRVATKIDYGRFNDLFLSVMKRPRTPVPAAPKFTDEWDYLKRKWREDVSDPSTGLAATALRAEISKNISPVMGADTEGVTALVASVANLDARDLPGDFPLDVALLPNTVAGEQDKFILRAENIIQ